MSAVLNKTRPIVLELNVDSDFSSIQPQHHKYVPLTYAAKFDMMAQKIIDIMYPYTKHGYKSTYVDYRVRELEPGDCGCPLEHWHLDVTRNPLHETRPDNHIIFSTVIGTEFMLDEIDCGVTDFSDILLPDDPEIFQAPSNAIVEYNRFNMHRGPIIKEPCKRVLIRITQTDVF